MKQTSRSSSQSWDTRISKPLWTSTQIVLRRKRRKSSTTWKVRFSSCKWPVTATDFASVSKSVLIHFRTEKSGLTHGLPLVQVSRWTRMEKLKVPYSDFYGQHGTRMDKDGQICSVRPDTQVHQAVIPVNKRITRNHIFLLQQYYNRMSLFTRE